MQNVAVNEQLPRSPYDMVNGFVYFPRMLDKIRLHVRGVLPEAYRNNLGRELDGHCLTFLHVQYSDLRERVLAGGSDEEILEWCFVNGASRAPVRSKSSTASCRRPAGVTLLASALVRCLSSRA